MCGFVEFAKGNRDDLVNTTKSEIAILQAYMPTPLTEEELNDIIEGAISEANATSIKDLGNVMKIITPQVKGKCDMKSVSTRIKDQLS